MMRTSIREVIGLFRRCLVRRGRCISRMDEYKRMNERRHYVVAKLSSNELLNNYSAAL